MLIGANGSGKSNLLEAIGLLRASPREWREVTRKGGGVYDWIWKGERKNGTAKIEALISNPRDCVNAYRKGNRSFAVVGELNPKTLESLLPSFTRAIRTLAEKL